VHARSQYERLEKAAGHRPNVSILKESVFVALWEQELRRPAAAVSM
jgi:hypothetical protein